MQTEKITTKWLTFKLNAESLIFIEVWLIYNILVSDVQQSDSKFLHIIASKVTVN